MAIGTLAGYLGRSWGWIVLRGVIAILFGVVSLARPNITLAALVLVWGVYAIADGVIALIGAFKIKDSGRPMWTLIVIGLLGLAAGVCTFLYPGITALVLLSFIAFWAIATGVLEI